MKIVFALVDRSSGAPGDPTAFYSLWSTEELAVAAQRSHEHGALLTVVPVEIDKPDGCFDPDPMKTTAGGDGNAESAKSAEENT